MIRMLLLFKFWRVQGRKKVRCLIRYVIELKRQVVLNCLGVELVLAIAKGKKRVSDSSCNLWAQALRLKQRSQTLTFHQGVFML